MRSVANKSKKTTIVFRDFVEFEEATGLLWMLKHINELKMIGLSVMPDTDGSYRATKTNKQYLDRFCRRNPGYHVISETYKSEEIIASMGSESENWIVRTLTNSSQDNNYTRRYYLADGDGALDCELIEMICINKTNVIPFRRT